MVWLLKKHDYNVYSRNPLVSVSIELRFHPILKIGQGSAIPEFQDQIRSLFPIYQEGVVQVVNLNVSPNVDLREEKQYRFLDEDRKTDLILSADKLLLSCQNHLNREETLSKFDRGLSALRKVCGDINPLRIGTRYVNQIELVRISNDLGRSLAWEDLIKEDFLRMPADIANLKNTTYAMELNAPLDQGGLTLRYGLLKTTPEAENHFQFDSDRYIAEKFDLDKTNEILNEFVTDIYCLFSEMRGEALEKWMNIN